MKGQVSGSGHLDGSIVCPPRAKAYGGSDFVAGLACVRVWKHFHTLLLRLGSLGHAPPRPLPVVSNTTRSDANIPTVVDGGVRIVSTHIANNSRPRAWGTSAKRLAEVRPQALRLRRP